MTVLRKSYQLTLFALFLCSVTIKLTSGRAYVGQQHGYRRPNATYVKPAQNYPGVQPPGRYNQSWPAPANNWQPRGNATHPAATIGNQNIGWGQNGWQQTQQYPQVIHNGVARPVGYNASANPNGIWQQPGQGVRPVGVVPQRPPNHSNPYANLFN